MRDSTLFGIATAGYWLIIGTFFAYVTIGCFCASYGGKQAEQFVRLAWKPALMFLLFGLVLVLIGTGT